jgi:hypothetical protein
LQWTNSTITPPPAATASAQQLQSYISRLSVLYYVHEYIIYNKVSCVYYVFYILQEANERERDKEMARDGQREIRGDDHNINTCHGMRNNGIK